MKLNLASRVLIVVSLVVGALASFAAVPETGSVREYLGSSFNEVHTLVWGGQSALSVDSPDLEEEQERSLYGSGKLPQYEVSTSKFVQGGVDLLLQAAKRTTSEPYDYYPRIPKLLHSNGVCLKGVWEITEANPYSGYFAQGSKGLFIGRVSVAATDTTSEDRRGFGFAGKIFPTLNENEVVKTGNFFAVDVLTGRKTDHFIETAMTNNPDVGFTLNPGVIWMMLKIKNALSAADSNPTFRPLYPISELKETGAVRTPRFMKIRVAEGTAKVDAPDFRDEVREVIRKQGAIHFEILVSDSKDRPDPDSAEGWTRVGQIVTDNAVVSYGCDRQLHFAHPKMK